MISDYFFHLIVKGKEEKWKIQFRVFFYGKGKFSGWGKKIQFFSQKSLKAKADRGRRVFKGPLLTSPAHAQEYVAFNWTLRVLKTQRSMYKHYAQLKKRDKCAKIWMFFAQLRFNGPQMSTNVMILRHRYLRTFFSIQITQKCSCMLHLYLYK